ncbi:MAG TPA: glucose-6-phosphate dehydrogenase [Polyangiaceae bacterium]|nr:glucose-6-phosphate dehydrogenase [Polyangiaceae bacterium]
MTSASPTASNVGSITGANPFRAHLETERSPVACVFVIFGASGDLTRRKLLPALYNLAVSRLLPPGMSVLGFALPEMSEDRFRSSMHDAVAEFSRRKPVDEAVWGDFASRLHYMSGKFEDPHNFARLRAKLDELDRTNGTGGNRIYYLAVPPSAFRVVSANLAGAGLVANPEEPTSYTRIIVEKPFGRDLASSDALNADLHRVFDESQIFRIDHYLGKETVQNLVALRFGNAIFEPLWNRNHIDHLQITVAEDIGVELRGKFYEEAGAMRDIVQNHLLQLLMVTAMEPPVSFTANEVRDEKVKVLRALRPIAGADVGRLTVRGQYGPGNFAGHAVCGYRQELNVSPSSNVETFVAMRLEVDNWRFAGVPVYVRAGKRLTKRVTEISIHFKQVPHALLGRRATPADSGLQMNVPSGDASQVDPDVLAIRIQPDEGIGLRFVAKVPGPSMTLRPVTMDFRYGSAFGGSGPEAYERLILDAMLGDPTLFARVDEVTAAWRFVTPILEAWSDAGPSPFPNYAAGTWGPQASFDLIERDGRSWRRL